MATRISSIVRCHNNGATISRAIESLLAQDLAEPVEIVVVDDASTDDSWERIQHFAGSCRAVRLDRNVGYVEAARIGLAEVTGQFFFLLDADDYAEPDMARRLMEALENHPAASYAYCDYYEETADGRQTIVSVGDRIARLVACNAMFRRATFADTEFWEDDLLLPEHGLAVRLLLEGDAVYVPIPLYHYTRHAASLTHQVEFSPTALAQLDARYGKLSATGKFQDLTVADCRAAGARTPRVWGR
jgi:glycosyltransferase involved in cell wall biosynthesis